MRLNKFISESGICSRREADRYLAQGTVLVNGKPAQVGDQVGPRDRVTVNGQKLEARQAEDAVYLAFNKPVGITSTSESGVRDNMVNYVNHPARVFPIGRLDKESSGLIFLTSDGDIVNKILRAGNKHEKEYLVTVNRILTDAMLAEMAQGVSIMGVMTKKCTVQKETPYIFRITLVQGLNRQIRRMVEQFGYEVTKLERVRIMNVSLKGLPLGEWRDLTAEELAGIMQAQAEGGSGGQNGVVGGWCNSWQQGCASAPQKPRQTAAVAQKSVGYGLVGAAPRQARWWCGQAEIDGAAGA